MNERVLRSSKTITIAKSSTVKYLSKRKIQIFFQKSKTYGRTCNTKTTDIHSSDNPLYNFCQKIFVFSLFISIQKDTKIIVDNLGKIF